MYSHLLGHVIDGISELPLVVSDKIQEYNKTKQAVLFLRRSKIWGDVLKVSTNIYIHFSFCEGHLTENFIVISNLQNLIFQKSIQIVHIKSIKFQTERPSRNPPHQFAFQFLKFLTKVIFVRILLECQRKLEL